MRLSKFVKVCALALTLAVVTPSIAPMNNVAVAEAATAIKLNKTKLSLNVGDTAKLKISGTKSKVTWASNKKTVATVDKTGKVTAVKAGSATITATVNKKKYTCKVTVKAVNPNIAKAPFKAQEVVFGDFKAVIPKDWVNQLLANEQGTYISNIYSKLADTTNGATGVGLILQYNGKPKTDYVELKEYLLAVTSDELITSQYAAQGIQVIVTDLKTSDFETTLGTAFKTEFKVDMAGTVISQTIYDISIDNYFIKVTVGDKGDGTKPDVYTVAEYLLNTLEIVK